MEAWREHCLLCSFKKGAREAEAVGYRGGANGRRPRASEAGGHPKSKIKIL